MRLLYADLPERPDSDDSDPAERARLDLLVGGVVAAVGVAAIGGGLVSDLLRRREELSEVAAAAVPPTTTGFVGVERVVAPSADPEQTFAELAPAPELEFAPPAAPGLDPESLPAPGPPVRTITAPGPAPEPGPDVAEAPPVTTTPPTTAPPTTTPPTTAPTPTEPPPTEPPPTGPPPTTVPVSTTVPAVTTDAPDPAPTTTAAPPTTTVPTTTVPTTTSTMAPAVLPVVQVLAADTGFVATPAMRAVVSSGGVEAWVDGQLTPGSVEDPVVDDALAGFDLLDVDPATLGDGVHAGRAHAQQQWAGFTRALVSERQVLEAAVGTWQEHFTTSLTSQEAVALEQVIRRHALGEYRDLLVAVAHTPGVLRASGATAVDGRSGRPVSTAFARILAEDFGPGTLSVDEIGAVARVLSGWGVDDAGRFVFDASKHSADPARVAGWMTPGRAGAAGLDDGVSLLRHLAAMPGTARRVVTLLARRMAGAGASDRVVERAVGVYLAEGTSTAAVTRVVLLESSGGGRSERRGGEWLLAALRALGASVDITAPWNRRLAGSIPHELRVVGADPARARRRRERGHPVDWWSSPEAVSARWAVARRLTDGENGVAVDLDRLRPHEAVAAHRWVHDLATRLGTALDAEEAQALLDYLGLADDVVVGPATDLPLADLAALVLSFPSFMRRDGGGG